VLWRSPWQKPSHQTEPLSLDGASPDYKHGRGADGRPACWRSAMKRSESPSVRAGSMSIHRECTSLPIPIGWLNGHGGLIFRVLRDSFEASLMDSQAYTGHGRGMDSKDSWSIWGSWLCSLSSRGFFGSELRGQTCTAQALSSGSKDSGQASG